MANTDTIIDCIEVLKEKLLEALRCRLSEYMLDKSLQNTVSSLVLMAINENPSTDAIFGDKSNVETFILGLKDATNNEMAILFNRITYYMNVEFTEVIEHLTRFAYIHYDVDDNGTAKNITKAIQEVYKDNPQFLVLRLMELFNLDELHSLSITVIKEK